MEADAGEAEGRDEVTDPREAFAATLAELIRRQVGGRLGAVDDFSRTLELIGRMFDHKGETEQFRVLGEVQGLLIGRGYLTREETDAINRRFLQ
jgi:hypothetical protein